jgi:hypothetical protein
MFRQLRKHDNGTAEAVVGELVEDLRIRDPLFLAVRVSPRKALGRDPGPQRRQVQGQELHRHRDLSSRRSSRCLVLCRSGFSGTGHDRDLGRRRRVTVCMAGQ